MFELSLNVKQFFLTHSKNLVRCYHSKLEWTWEWWQWRGTLHYPKISHYWSLSIRLFHIISGKFVVGGSLTPLQRCNHYILLPQPTGLHPCRRTIVIILNLLLGAIRGLFVFWGLMAYQPLFIQIVLFQTIQFSIST